LSARCHLFKGEIVRICVAQLRPAAGDVEANVCKHLALLDLALSHEAQMVFFPELSLTGYETKLATRLATNQGDPRLNVFQTMADTRSLCIGVGIPTVAGAGTEISMIVFQPGRPRVTYSKQLLHADEAPYFAPGNQQIVLNAAAHSVAPAICYESLQDSHAEQAAELGADIYLASVAKPTRGVNQAYSHYPAVARRHAMTVLMANCIGPCDDFVAVGQSAVWNSSGELLTKLDSEHEGIVLFDTLSREAAAHYLRAPDLDIRQP
jgi:predicted amidohydrolase